MTNKLHLILSGVGPYAAADTRLHALLATMTPEPGSRIDCDDDSPDTPLERATAQALALPGMPGHVPWAAHATGTLGVPCAWVSPCHWAVGADHVRLLPFDALALDAATSQALLDAMTPWFAEDGISLRKLECGGSGSGSDGDGCFDLGTAASGAGYSWLAVGEPLRGLATVSAERAVGQRLTPELLDVRGPGAATLRRLQNEMQMLLYTHPITEALQSAGRLAPNGFWVHGAGVLDALPPQPEMEVVVAGLTRAAAVSGLTSNALPPADGLVAEAWMPDHVRHDKSGTWDAGLAQHDRPVGRLTLCGGRAAQSFAPTSPNFSSRLKAAFGLRKPWSDFDQL